MLRRYLSSTTKIDAGPANRGTARTRPRSHHMANEERVALVTGGSGGIGRPTALRLAEDGMAVAVAYSGNSGEIGRAHV